MGKYEIAVSASGFQDFHSRHVAININTSLTVDITLLLAEQKDTVTVDAGAVTVKTTDTQIGQTIESKQVTDIPLNGRSYTDLLAIQAGVSPITTSGAGKFTF